MTWKPLIPASFRHYRGRRAPAGGDRSTQLGEGALGGGLHDGLELLRAQRERGRESRGFRTHAWSFLAAMLRRQPWVMEDKRWQTSTSAPRQLGRYADWAREAGAAVVPQPSGPGPLSQREKNANAAAEAIVGVIDERAARITIE